MAALISRTGKGELKWNRVNKYLEKYFSEGWWKRKQEGTGVCLLRVIRLTYSALYSCVLLWLYLLAKNLNNRPMPK